MTESKWKQLKANYFKHVGDYTPIAQLALLFAEGDKMETSNWMRKSKLEAIRDIAKGYDCNFMRNAILEVLGE